MEEKIPTEEKQKTDKELKEIEHAKQAMLIQMKNDYITNLVNGRYFLARYNMMVPQIESGKIEETVDGCLKTKEYMIAEAIVFKRQALAAFRSAHFGQLDLKKEFKLTDEDIIAIETDCYDGKIIRETYDEGYKRGSKAEFVNK